MSPISLEGQTLGKYRVLEPLGQGGMARVYRAYHPALDRYVAVKVLRSDLLEDEFLARFRREAQSVASLRHPHIVQVFDFDVQDDVYYMVMELLGGDTLKARLNDYRAHGMTMPSGESVRILLDVLDGLAYAHGEGMIHRDLKPANIMLTRHGQAVITDFGIAQIVGSTRYTVSGALMGTLNYMAPEQGLEGRADTRSDIYSLGIVLYEAFTGHPPFDADTPLAILMKHVNDPLPLPRGEARQIPEPFERVVLKALSKRPGERYGSATEMAQALRQAAQAAAVELPERIPVSVTPQALAAPALADPPAAGVPLKPKPPVPVYSGTARAALGDASFAMGETDPDLAARLSDQPAPEAELPSREQPAVRAMPERERRKWTLVGAITLLATANVCAIIAADTLWRWDLFWPFEVLMAATVLALIMGAIRNIWMLIPTAIGLGTAAILAFYGLTGAWNFWYLWLLEVPLVAGVIMATMLIATSRRGQAGGLARTAGLSLALAGGGLLSLYWLAVFAKLAAGG